MAKGSAVKRTKRTKLVETDVDDNDRAPAKVRVRQAAPPSSR